MATRPVHLVTGFLGSGKTTLLARALREPAFADLRGINELGEVGPIIFGRSGSDDDVVLLESGCCALSV